jgi:hypothetical protein
VVPYALAVAVQPPRTLGLPLPVLLAASGVQSTVILFLLAWAGLRLGATSGLDSPFVRAWVSKSAPSAHGRWVQAVAVGVAAAAAIVVLDKVVFDDAVVRALTRAGRTMPHAARWKGALASFYGGIAEEIQLRLFFMTAVAWCLAKATHGTPGWIFVLANIVAALAFGAGHLPLAAKVFGLTTMIVVRTVALNSLAGIAFGALYARWGLEHAMVAHFTSDIVLHVVLGG